MHVACCRCAVKKVTKKSSLQMNKFLLWRKLENKQNDGVYAWSSKEAHKLVTGIDRGHYPVWWGVSYDGITSLHFCEKGVKIETRNYQQDILRNVEEPLNQIYSKIDHDIQTELCTLIQNYATLA